VNAYSYSDDNPISNRDPNGRELASLLGMAAGYYPTYYYESHQIELGDAANQLAMENPTWGYAFEHPYRTGAVVGALSVVGADSAVSTFAAFNAARFAGISASYAAKQAVATGYYSTLTLGSLGAIPSAVNTAAGIDFNQRGSALTSAFSLTVQIGPTLVGGYTGAISDIFQFLGLLDQGLTTLIRSNTQIQSPNTGVRSSSSNTSAQTSGGIGVGILAFVAYINWFKDTKSRTIRWIATRVFGSKFQNDTSAERLFMNITVILLIIGLMWLGLGIGYLTS
jgi:hypothetical protein